MGSGIDYTDHQIWIQSIYESYRKIHHILNNPFRRIFWFWACWLGLRRGRSGPSGHARYRVLEKMCSHIQCIGDWGKDCLIITGLQLSSQASCRDHKHTSDKFSTVYLSDILFKLLPSPCRVRKRTVISRPPCTFQLLFQGIMSKFRSSLEC